MNAGTSVLLNFLIIIVLVFVDYFMVQSFSRLREKETTVRTIRSLVTIMSCILVPISMKGSLDYNFELVPLLIGSLYSGVEAAVILFAATLGMEWILDGVAHATGFAVAAVVLFPFVAALSDFYLKRRLIWRNVLFIALLAGATTLHVAILRRVTGIRETDYLYLMLLNVAVGWVNMMLVEIFSELTRMRERIFGYEKLSFARELAAAFAHEIRNPLTVAKGFVQLLRETPVHQEKHHAYLTLVEEDLAHAEQIINDYLVYARPELASMEEIEVTAELRHVSDLMYSYGVGHGVNVTVYLHCPETYIIGDRGKLYQALINIMKNGIEAMSEGGTLTVRLSRLNRQLAIAIQDQGVGMTDEEVKRLGIPFYSNKANGTGLGMMVSYSIIEMMKGQVHVMSEKGVGTVFTILFPIAREG